MLFCNYWVLLASSERGRISIFPFVPNREKIGQFKALILIHLRFFSDEIGFSFLISFGRYYIVFAKYLDGSIGTDKRTETAAGTVGISYLSWEVAFFVGFFGNYDAVLWAYDYTQPTSFTSFGINFYFAGHHIFLFTAESAEHAEIT